MYVCMYVCMPSQARCQARPRDYVTNVLEQMFWVNPKP